MTTSLRSLAVITAECKGVSAGCHKSITLQREISLCNHDPLCVQNMLQIYGWTIVEKGLSNAYCPICRAEIGNDSLLL